MRRLQAVTVRTKNPQVLEPIVVLVAVDMIELDGDAAVLRLLRPAAELASLLL